jgi:DNA modification methylase
MGGGCVSEKIIEMELEKLIPYARNPRKNDHAVDRIASAIREFGFKVPVIAKSDGTIVDGHLRLKAAQKLGMEAVPVLLADDLSDAQIKAFRLSVNKMAELAEWDDELLHLELDELRDMDFDLDLTGFDQKEIDDIFADTALNIGLTDPDDAPPINNQQSPITKTGDVWVMGKHRLMCGDSTSIDAVEELMQGESAELCFTSPPYSDQREYNGGKELSTEYLATFVRSSYGFVKYFAVNLGYSRKNGEVNQYWNDYIKEAEDCGLKLLSWNVWDRSGLGGSIGNQTAFFPIWHEWIFVFGEKAKELNRTKKNKSAGSKSGTNRQADGTLLKGSGVTAEFGKMGTVTACGVADGKLHPAMFPVELPEEYINAMTDEGDCVYEPFGGSGTTLIACEKTGREARLMELDPKYCDVIIKRWQEFTGKQAILEADGRLFGDLEAEE